MYLIRRARNSRYRTQDESNQDQNLPQFGNANLITSIQDQNIPLLRRNNTLQRNLAIQGINHSDSTLINATFEETGHRPQNVSHTSTRSHRDRRNSTLSETETLVPDMILGHPLSEFNSVRSLPIVSIRFQRGLYVFASNESFEKYKEESKDTEIRNFTKTRTSSPLLHLSSSYLTMFKKNCPFLVIYKFNSPLSTSPVISRSQSPINIHPHDMNIAPGSTPTDQINCSKNHLDNKTEYCKVYFKHQPQDILSYKLKFQPTGETTHPSNFQIMMYYHPTKPFIDTIYKKTRLRWIGFSPQTQQYTNSFKVIVLNDDSPSLIDGIVDHFDAEDWDNDESLYPMPNAVNTQRSQEDLFAMLSSMLPVAKYEAASTYLLPIKSITKKGEVRSMDCIGTGGSNTGLNEDFGFIKEHTLVLTCMILVLRDHEMKKAQTGYGRGAYGNQVQSFL